MSFVELFDDWFATRLSEEAREWISARQERIAGGNLKELYLGFGQVSRKIPKLELGLSTAELDAAERLRPGWQPGHWSLPDTVRMRLLLGYRAESSEKFVEVLDRLFATGEVHELIALYQGLPLYPDQPMHVARAGEGIRTNMGAVFQAVAHRNPYPCEQLPEGMWNQMILKCLFVGISLIPVVGLESRNNPALTGMLRDYAHERWAARREVSPELWRCVKPEHQAEALEDLARVLREGTEVEQRAAALSLSSSRHGEAAKLLEQYPGLRAEIDAGRLTWSEPGRN